MLQDYKMENTLSILEAPFIFITAESHYLNKSQLFRPFLSSHSPSDCHDISCAQPSLLIPQVFCGVDVWALMGAFQDLLFQKQFFYWLECVHWVGIILEGTIPFFIFSFLTLVTRFCDEVTRYLEPFSSVSRAVVRASVEKQLHGAPNTMLYSMVLFQREHNDA